MKKPFEGVPQPSEGETQEGTDNKHRQSITNYEQRLSKIKAEVASHLNPETRVKFEKSQFKVEKRNIDGWEYVIVTGNIDGHDVMLQRHYKHGLANYDWQGSVDGVTLSRDQVKKLWDAYGNVVFAHNTYNDKGNTLRGYISYEEGELKKESDPDFEQRQNKVIDDLIALGASEKK